jgi:hypothetical protein
LWIDKIKEFLENEGIDCAKQVDENHNEEESVRLPATVSRILIVNFIYHKVNCLFFNS